MVYVRKFSITDKLIIAALLLSVVTILIVASYSFFSAKSAILDRSFNQLNSVRVIKTNLIEKFFTNCIKEVNLAKSSTDISKIVNQINKQDSSKYYKKINDKLLISRTQFIKELSKDYYNRIFIIGKNRIVYNLKEEVNHKQTSKLNYDSLWEKSILYNDVYVQDYKKIKGFSPAYITISSKITDSLNNIEGVIVFEILPSAIDSTMLNKDPSSGLGTSGESYLVGQDYLMRSSSRFHENSVLNTIVRTEAVKSAFNNSFGTKVIDDYRGISVLSSYKKIFIPNLNWVILAEIDYQEVTIPVYKIRNEILFISILIFVIILIVIIVLSKKITYPIQKLNQAAHEVGTGNLDIEISSDSDDEIGELTHTFNQMVEKLKLQTKELEKERIKSLRSLIDGQETERQRLSRELHDSLGQLLIGLKLKYESCTDKSRRKSKEFIDLGLLFDQTIEETRRISNNLMPATLSEFGLSTAIRNICNDITESSNLSIKFNTLGSSKNLRTEVKIYLFRIIQEALTNILKHSEAQNASINLNFTDNKIFIDIEDNGKGFVQSIKQKNTNGLNNIKDRVSLLSGKLNIDTKLNKGTKIHIEIPIKTKKDG